MEPFRSSLDYIFHKLADKRTFLGVCAIVAILSWVAVFANAKTSQLEVYFFDVGQGDAIFVRMPDGRQILIDAGPNDKVIEKLNKVMPFYDRDLDMVVATHNDLDHIGGLPAVFEHYEVETVIWNGVETDTKIFGEFNEAMKSEGAEILAGKCCMRFTLSSEAFFEILHPFNRSGSDPDRLKQNDFSIVIRLVYGGNSFLFTGDIERRQEYELLKSGFNIESDVLKIAHHGSKTSSSELFLGAVKPSLAVISAGRNNPYGHPYEAILQRIASYGIDIRRTDMEGDVVIMTND